MKRRQWQAVNVIITLGTLSHIWRLVAAITHSQLKSQNVQLLYHGHFIFILRSDTDATGPNRACIILLGQLIQYPFKD